MEAQKRHVKDFSSTRFVPSHFPQTFEVANANPVFVAKPDSGALICGCFPTNDYSVRKKCPRVGKAHYSRLISEMFHFFNIYERSLRQHYVLRRLR